MLHELYHTERFHVRGIFDKLPKKTANDSILDTVFWSLYATLLCPSSTPFGQHEVRCAEDPTWLRTESRPVVGYLIRCSQPMYVERCSV